MELHRQELLQEAASARLARLAGAHQYTLTNRLFYRLGVVLIIIGAGLKQHYTQPARTIQLTNS